MKNTATTYKSAQDAVAADDAIIYAPVYVFPTSKKDELCINGYDALEVVYSDRSADAVRYSEKNYGVSERFYGCGVTRVRCIFVKGRKA